MTPESALKREICQALTKMGKPWIRIQCGKVKVRGGYMQLAPEGTADLFLLPDLWVETKAGAKHTDVQKQFQALVESLGMRYIVAESLDDVLRGLEGSK